MARIRRALQDQNPANRQVLIPLGGSGQTVGSWAGVEKKSREMPVLLDIKEFDAKAELDQHADVVVIMLGMNDVLSAQLKDTPEALKKWKEDYRGLLTAVRTRTTPRVIALATPTPCTEDPESPKNQVMDRMVATLKELAAEEKCLLLPTRETAWTVLANGRRTNPGFHITTDQVHPNPAGHMAIAAGMLTGLGEAVPGEALVRQAMEKSPSGDRLSFQWELLSPEDVGSPLRLRLTVFHNTESAALDLPKGWTAREETKAEGKTTWVLESRLDRLVNTLTIRSGGRSAEVRIPAPWLVGTGNVGWLGWKNGVYVPETGGLPPDEVVRTGVGFREAMSRMELKPGVPVSWRAFLGDVNYGGAGAPGVIDFAQVTYFGGGEVGYGLRWIESDKDRPVRVKISRPGFAGKNHVQVWINGENVYSGDPEKARDGEWTSTLRKGWNLVSFKGNFQSWQWQLGLDLEPVAGDSLDGLRYAITPR